MPINVHMVRHDNRMPNVENVRMHAQFLIFQMFPSVLFTKKLAISKPIMADLIRGNLMVALSAAMGSAAAIVLWNYTMETESDLNANEGTHTNDAEKTTIKTKKRVMRFSTIEQKQQNR